MEQKKVDTGIYTEDEFLRLGSKEEKIDYVNNILGFEDSVVYGKVIGKTDKTLFIAPYDIRGERAYLFCEAGEGWGIPSKRRKDSTIEKNDFVKGKIFIVSDGTHAGELNIKDIKRMDSFEEFRKKLYSLLKEKWKREGFKFALEDIVRYDGTVDFDEWVSYKVEAMLEEKYEAYIQGKMQRREQELRSLSDEIDRTKDEIETYERRKKGLETSLEKLKQDKVEAEKLYQHYRELGILSSKCQVDEKEDYPYCTFEKLIDDVWGYLWKKKHLYYERFTIKQFMDALRTQQLTILWGRPGTGKTSLPRAVAQALQAECIRVQVQSNWTDNQDLLGFYNIVDKRYVSTQFLDALVEAANRPEQIYLILLDEMNLSNVEYYFSEMLNVFTWDEPYGLHLYSERFKETVEAEYRAAENQQRDTAEFRPVLKDMYDYPPTFFIPSNVRFVGTLNTDFTTKTLSPKVVDRSCLIELQMLPLSRKKSEEESLPEEVALDGDRLAVKADLFEIRTAHLPEESALMQAVENIKGILGEAKVPISNRLNSYLAQWTGWDDTSLELDEVILEKILPVLDLENSSKNRDVIQKLKDNLPVNCEKSLRKIEKMEEYASETNRILYWED